MPMLAAVFEGPGRLAIRERPVPALAQDDDVLVRVHACGICGTDLHILAVPPSIPVSPGLSLGHEYTATIVEVGPAVAHVQPGDRVVIEPWLPCGLCDYCRLGLPNSCAQVAILGISRDGGMAGYSVAPARAVHKIHVDVPDHVAVLAEPLACVLNGLDKLKFQPGETALVLGAGPIGLLFVHLFRAAGAAKIIVSEVAPYRAQVAHAAGADLVVNPREHSLADIVRRETRLGADVVVDAVGWLFDVALQTARRGGRALLFGLDRHATPAIPQALITRHELSVVGAFFGSSMFPRAIRLLEAGRLPLASLVTHQFPLAEAPRAVELLRRGEGIKAVVLPQATE